MKNLILISISLLIFISCSNNKKEVIEPISNNSEQGIAVAKSQEFSETLSQVKISEGSKSFLSEVDTTSIKSFGEYDDLKMKLFGEYDDLKMKLFGEYDDLKMKAFDDYYSKEQEALMVVREKHNDLYLKWLDAEKIGDYATKMEIEKSKEFENYIHISKYEYKKYQSIEKSRYANYQKMEKKIYKEYKEKDKIAYKSYLKTQ